MLLTRVAAQYYSKYRLDDSVRRKPLTESETKIGPGRAEAPEGFWKGRGIHAEPRDSTGGSSLLLASPVPAAYRSNSLSLRAFLPRGD